MTNQLNAQKDQNKIFRGQITILFFIYVKPDLPFYHTWETLFGTIPILRHHIFGIFGPHPPYQHKYSTEHQQKWLFSRPTHPVILLT